MRIGEIIEILNQIRNDYFSSSNENEVVCIVCNILSKLPTTMEEDIVKERIKMI